MNPVLVVATANTRSAVAPRIGSREDYEADADEDGITVNVPTDGVVEDAEAEADDGAGGTPRKLGAFSHQYHPMGAYTVCC